MKKVFIFIIALVVSTDIIAQDSANILSVRSLSDLRSINHRSFAPRKSIAKDKPLVNLLGYYDPNDGGGGTFYYDDTSTVADNAGTIIRPVSVNGPGRWKRVFDREVNVLWFGAKRDYSSDASAAINAAIRAARPSNHEGYNQTSAYGTVYIPGGVYKCNATIKIRNQVTIIGDGGLNPAVETKLIFTTGVRGIDIDYFGGARAVTIKNLWLRNNGASTDSTAHGLYTNTKVILENVNVDNFGGNGFEINTVVGQNANNSILTNLSSIYCALNGLYIVGGESNNMAIRSSDFTNNGRCGILDYSFLGNYYENCHVSFNGVREATGFNKSWCRKGSKFYQCIHYYWHKGMEPEVTPGWENYWALNTQTFNKVSGAQVAPWNKDSTYFITAGYAIAGPACYSFLNGCYSEGGQGATILNGYSMAIAGDHGAGSASRNSIFLVPEINELIAYGKGFYVPDRDSLQTISGFDNQFGLILGTRKAGHAGLQAKYFESDRATRFYSNNSIDFASFEVLGYGHPGAKYGLTGNQNLGLSIRYPGFFMTDVNNVGVARKICVSQTGPPTYDEHAAGELCMNIGTDASIFGWKCIVSGKPGKWVAIKSASNNSSATSVTGTYIGNGGSAKVTIPHGLGRDPAWVGVTIRSADAAGIWYATHDAVNIYINYKTSTPSGNRNITIDWTAKL